MDKAWFFLMLHSGLRTGKVRRLRLEDLDFERQRVRIELSKGLKDRIVCLSQTTIQALQAYLKICGPTATSHLFAFRHLPPSESYCSQRLETYACRSGVKVTPHRLRHTCATQLLNAGCRVTSIQKFLGHQRLNSTMIYARVHDQTVANDYYAAMEQVEGRLALTAGANDSGERISSDERAQLLELVDVLGQPQLGQEDRLNLVEQMRRLLYLSLGTRHLSPSVASSA